MSDIVYLTRDQKLRSYFYITNYEISNNSEVKAKQYEMLDVLFKTYFTLCPKFNTRVRVLRTDDKKEIYTFYWNPKSLTIEQCDIILKEYKHLNNVFLEHRSLLLELIQQTSNPTYLQKCYADNFTQTEDWENNCHEDIKNRYHKYGIVYKREDIGVMESYSQIVKKDFEYNLYMHDITTKRYSNRMLGDSVNDYAKIKEILNCRVLDCDPQFTV